MQNTYTGVNDNTLLRLIKRFLKIKKYLRILLYLIKVLYKHTQNLSKNLSILI